jgi:hypothetical protein
MFELLVSLLALRLLKPLIPTFFSQETLCQLFILICLQEI